MEQTIEIGGVEVHYTRSGKGNPMILMHGWGCDHTALSLFERVGAEHHEVFNIDLPGFGKSSEPPVVWGIDEYTRMLERFVELLGLHKPTILGHSFGGRIALLYASRNNVDRLILVDAAGVKPRRSLKYFAKVYSFKLAKKIYPLILGKEKASEMINRRRASAGSTDYNNASPMMKQVLVKAVNTDLCHVMPLIQAPTQLIWGEKDTATPMRDARIMARKIPNSGLISFPGAGHFSFVDNPFQSAAVVRRFIADTAMPQSSNS